MTTEEVRCLDKSGNTEKFRQRWMTLLLAKAIIR
jgi:hypothetical protein